MDKFAPEYSLKNIPFPGKHEFILCLTDKIVEFIKRMRWKSPFYFNPFRLTTEEDSQQEEVEFTKDTTQQP